MFCVFICVCMCVRVNKISYGLIGIKCCGSIDHGVCYNRLGFEQSYPQGWASMQQDAWTTKFGTINDLGDANVCVRRCCAPQHTRDDSRVCVALSFICAVLTALIVSWNFINFARSWTSRELHSPCTSIRTCDVTHLPLIMSLTEITVAAAGGEHVGLYRSTTSHVDIESERNSALITTTRRRYLATACYVWYQMPICSYVSRCAVLLRVSSTPISNALFCVFITGGHVSSWRLQVCLSLSHVSHTYTRQLCLWSLCYTPRCRQCLSNICFWHLCCR